MSPFEAIKRHAKDKPTVYAILIAGVVTFLVGMQLHIFDPPKEPDYTLVLHKGVSLPSGMVESHWFQKTTYRYEGTNADGTTLYWNDGDKSLAFSDQRRGNTLPLDDLRDDRIVEIRDIDAKTGALTLHVSHR